MTLAGTRSARTDGSRATVSGLPYLPDATARVQPGDAAFRWPVRFPDIAPALEDLPTRLLEIADQLDDDEARKVLVGSISFLVATLAYAEAAIYLEAAQESGIGFDNLPPAAAYLTGTGASDELPVPFSVKATTAGKAPPLSRLREYKIAAEWNGLKAFGALFRPDVVAISTNALVKQAAHDEHRSIRYRFQWDIFNARAARGPAYDIDCKSLARKVAEALVDGIDIVTGRFRERLHELVRHEAELAFSVAAHDLSRLSGIDELPQELWSGTGGHYPSRLIGLEVMRRGGIVRRFGHGLNAGIMYQRQKPFRVTEFSVSTEYSAPTKAFADLMVQTDTLTGTPARFRPQLRWGRGDSHSPADSGGGRFRASIGRPRVLYAPTVPRGFRQYLSPQLPDVVYRDWQHRLVAMLQQLPIDLVCTLHPRERALAAAHPCVQAGKVTSDGFETVIGEADVVLFDYLKSTTIAAALPTTVPVIFIDLEGLAFEPVVFAELERRCTVIKATYDDAGRPNVDADVLGQALCRTHAEPDPDFFRRLYVGDDA